MYQQSNISPERKVSMPTSCSAIGCGNRLDDTKPVRFYRFPAESKPKRRKRWISAVNKLKKDGSPWKPSVHSRICSDHFIYGKPLDDPKHPDYVPSVFTKECKEQETVRKVIPLNQYLGSPSKIHGAGVTIKFIKLKPGTFNSRNVQSIVSSDSIALTANKQNSGQQQLQDAALYLGENIVICSALGKKNNSTVMKNTVDRGVQTKDVLCRIEFEMQGLKERLSLLECKFKSYEDATQDRGGNISPGSGTCSENCQAVLMNTNNRDIPTEEVLRVNGNEIASLKRELCLVERDVKAQCYIRSLAKQKNVGRNSIVNPALTDGEHSENQVLKSTSQAEKQNWREDLSHNLTIIDHDAKSGCLRALFLLELFENYNQRRSSWSDDMLRLFATWQSTCYKAYRYVKNTAIRAMPSPGNPRLMQIKKQLRKKKPRSGWKRELARGFITKTHRR